MRVLFMSNGPWAQTGYGTETRYILRGIRDAGYPVACVAFWGLYGGNIEWEGIPVYPGSLDQMGHDAASYACRHFKADVLFTLYDIWGFDPAVMGNLGNVRWCPYFPVDTTQLHPMQVERFGLAHRLLAYSRHGERLVREAGYGEKVRYVPHGVDCEVYHPETEQERADWRREAYPEWPADAFIVGMVAANKGMPSRKSFPEVMEAFAGFAGRHPEARLYLHTCAGPDYRGPDLRQMATYWGVGDKVRYATAERLIMGGYGDAEMRHFYNTFDVLLSPSQGEGFGIPIVEAQACGVPVIVNDHSAMSEVVGDGWRVAPLRSYKSLLGGEFAEADPAAIEQALEECYRRPRIARVHYGQVAREFALQYDWPYAWEAWRGLLAELDAGRSQLDWEIQKLQMAEVRRSCRG